MLVHDRRVAERQRVGVVAGHRLAARARSRAARTARRASCRRRRRRRCGRSPRSAHAGGIAASIRRTGCRPLVEPGEHVAARRPPSRPACGPGPGRTPRRATGSTSTATDGPAAASDAEQHRDESPDDGHRRRGYRRGCDDPRRDRSRARPERARRRGVLLPHDHRSAHRATAHDRDLVRGRPRRRLHDGRRTRHARTGCATSSRTPRCGSRSASTTGSDRARVVDAGTDEDTRVRPLLRDKYATRPTIWSPGRAPRSRSRSRSPVPRVRRLSGPRCLRSNTYASSSSPNSDATATSDGSASTPFSHCSRSTSPPRSSGTIPPKKTPELVVDGLGERGGRRDRSAPGRRARRRGRLLVRERVGEHGDDVRADAVDGDRGLVVVDVLGDA